MDYQKVQGYKWAIKEKTKQIKIGCPNEHPIFVVRSTRYLPFGQSIVARQVLKVFYDFVLLAPRVNLHTLIYFARLSQVQKNSGIP